MIFDWYIMPHSALIANISVIGIQLKMKQSLESYEHLYIRDFFITVNPHIVFHVITYWNVSLHTSVIASSLNIILKKLPYKIIQM